MTQLGKSHLEIFILAGLEAEVACERVTRLGKSHLEIFILAGSEAEAAWRARVESDAAR